MTSDNKVSALASAVSAIQILSAEKVGIEAQLSACINELVSQESMLNSLLAEPKTIANEQYLEASIQACKTGIMAWNLSIEAYQQDMENCTSEMNAISKNYPEAGMA